MCGRAGTRQGGTGINTIKWGDDSSKDCACKGTKDIVSDRSIDSKRHSAHAGAVRQ